MKQLLGGCLQAVGFMIAGLTDLCTLMGMVVINSWQSFVSALLGFGTPFAIGVGLILAGRALIHSAREDRY